MPTQFDNDQHNKENEKSYYKRNLEELVKGSYSRNHNYLNKDINCHGIFKNEYSCNFGEPLMSWQVEEKENLRHKVKILGTQLEDVRRKAANLPRLKEKLGKAEKENEVLKKENKVLKKNNAEFNEVYDRSEILDL